MLLAPLLAGASLFFLLPLALCAGDYYEILGLDRSASDRDIKRAYRNLSKRFHPDKNPGDDAAHQKFVDIAEAYDVLSTTETRRIYDRYGHEGLEQHKQGGGQAHDPFDIFSRFFGGGGHFGRSSAQRRGPDMEARLDVPLRDFYNGKAIEFKIEKQVICESCEGSGSADGAVDVCDECGGRGRVIRKQMLAPGIFQQVQMACDKCGGKGKSIRHPCAVCQGSKVVRNAVDMSVYIEPGMAKGARVVFENEGDESPEWVAGDLVVTVMEDEPALGGDESESESDEERTDGTFFRRKGQDLFWKEVLSLREAWMGGWTRNLTHLDGHTVYLERDRGQVVQPQTVETIRGEGMPIVEGEHNHGGDNDNDGRNHGSLYVEYSVVLPDDMESGMEKDFHALWEKWRKKNGVDLAADSGRPVHDEL